MVDDQTNALLVTFGFDMGIFLLELLVFFCIRSKRDANNVLLNWKPQNEYFRDFNDEDLRPSMQR